MPLARYPGNTNHFAQRQGQRHLLEVIAGSALKRDLFSVPLAAFGRHRNLLFSIEVRGRSAPVLQESFRSRGGNYLSPVSSGSRPDVYDVVGVHHHVFVVLYHDDGVAQITQILQGLDELHIVALVQPNARLIQNIEHPHQLRADLCRQPDALGLATRKGTQRAVEG